MRSEAREASIPIVGIDYMWMTGEEDEGGDESLRAMPILALVDQESGWVSSWLVPKKKGKLVRDQSTQQTSRGTGVQYTFTPE